MKGYMPHGKKFDYGEWWDSFKSDVKDKAGSAAEWSFNHSPARAVYGEFDWDDPNSMKRWSNAQIMGFGPGDIANTRYQEMQENELNRWKEEVSKYYGVDPEDIAYPFRAGMVSGFGGYGPAVSDSVRDLYNVSLRMWKK